jgi:RNA polymerase sigma-32 factor
MLDGLLRDREGARPTRSEEFLTREEERILVAKAQDGDIEARNRIVLAHLPLVNRIVIARATSSRDKGDLVAQGVIGLIAAVDLIDRRRANRFATYAAYHVLAAVNDAMRTDKSVVMLSQGINRRILNNLGKAKAKAGVLGPSPMRWSEAVAVARVLGSDPSDVVDVDNRINVEPMDAEALDRSEIRLLNPTIDLGDLHEEVAARQIVARLGKAIESAVCSLSERDRDFLASRLLTDEPDTLTDMGRRWGVSTERARQIDEALVTRIRKAVAHADPSLVPEMSSELRAPFETNPRRRRLERIVRITGHGENRRRAAYVVDESDAVVARYEGETGNRGLAECFIRGYATTGTLGFVDHRGIGIVNMPKGRGTPASSRILHHGTEIASMPDEESAKAWVDGMKLAVLDRSPPTGRHLVRWSV